MSSIWDRSSRVPGGDEPRCIPSWSGQPAVAPPGGRGSGARSPTASRMRQPVPWCRSRWIRRSSTSRSRPETTMTDHRSEPAAYRRASGRATPVMLRRRGFDEAGCGWSPGVSSPSSPAWTPASTPSPSSASTTATPTSSATPAGVITDDVIRSLCLSQRFLGTQEIVLVHHTDCGLQKVDEARVPRRSRSRARREALVVAGDLLRPVPGRAPVDPAALHDPVHHLTRRTSEDSSTTCRTDCSTRSGSPGASVNGPSRCIGTWT